MVKLLFLNISITLQRMSDTVQDKMAYRGQLKDNFSYFSKTCYDPSLEPSQQDVSNDGWQHVLRE